jgi:hypothetical protein
MPQKLETRLNHGHVGASIHFTANGGNRSIPCTIDVVGHEVELGRIKIEQSTQEKGS